MGMFLLSYPENQHRPSPGTRYDMYRSPKLVCPPPPPVAALRTIISKQTNVQASFARAFPALHTIGSLTSTTSAMKEGRSRCAVQSLPDFVTGTDWICRIEAKSDDSKETNDADDGTGSHTFEIDTLPHQS